MEYWSAITGFCHRAVDIFDTALIGIVGAFVAYVFSSKDKTLEKKEARQMFFLFLIAGGAITYFTAPALMLIFNIEAGFASTVAFLVGALGGSLLAAVLKAINQMDLDLWPFIKSLIRAKLGVKNTDVEVSNNDQ